MSLFEIPPLFSNDFKGLSILSLLSFVGPKPGALAGACLDEMTAKNFNNSNGVRHVAPCRAARVAPCTDELFPLHACFITVFNLSRCGEFWEALCSLPTSSAPPNPGEPGRGASALQIAQRLPYFFAVVNVGK